ncbi:tyrosine-type recombinase/integrase [Janthinobacterium sp.]|uniref:tyrosine-type recombinase/integrase n=1 Tax=Janthinobacterium sp. TaxID=1871054 RepID=UPI00293D6232|nr:tyrosine-type recombinase/integrase [Janthinobacterium sp.]
MTKPKLSKPKSEVVKSLPSKIPYIYPYKLPSGEVRYRVRIRKKVFAGKPLDTPINEVYHTIEQAKKRLYDLEFGNVLQERAEMSRLISLGSSITISELFDEYHKKRLKDKKDTKNYRSKLNVIARTLIDSEDNRITKVANFSFNFNAHLANEQIKFGDFHVNNFTLLLLNRYVEARLQQVKPQTISNEIVLIGKVLKDSHNLFTQLKKIENPLDGFDWKSLKPIIVYRDKKVRTDSKKFIENILLKRSRTTNYYDMFQFLHETGCRISEALSVQVKDIDFDTRTIFVITKKNKQPRYLGLSPVLFPIIKKRCENKTPTDRIFSYTVDTYESKLTRLRPHFLKAGVVFKWHDLRHNYISRHLNSKNVLQIMHEMDINDMQYFQSQYLNVIQSEQAALKVAQSITLNPNEVANAVGHFENLKQTQEYTHYSPSPEFLQPKQIDLMEILRKQSEQLQMQQKQIEELIKLNPKKKLHY